MALAIDGLAMAGSPFSGGFSGAESSGVGSSIWDQSPAITGGKRLITIRGVAETEENKSIDSSYFFSSNSANAFRYRTVRNLSS